MTLRELLERERDRAAEAAAEKYWGPKEDLEDEERYSFDVEKSQHLAGFNHALDLLMPVVRIASELPDAEHGELREALAELEAKLGEG